MNHNPQPASRPILTLHDLPALTTEADHDHSHPLHMAGDVLAGHVLAMVEQATQEREARESVRANHRNLNRVMVLAFAAIAGFLVVFATNHGVAPGLEPYSFVVAIGLDVLVTLYAYLRHY